MRLLSKIKVTLVIVFILSGFVACSNTTDKTMFDENNQYTGFVDSDHSLTMDDCEKLGYVIVMNNDIESNKSKLEVFIKESNEGNDSYLRFAHFEEEDSEVSFYTDLIHDEDGYSFYYEDTKNLEKNPYKYVKVLSGEWGNPIQAYTMVVVCDREDLTFDEVNRSMISSNMNEINEIGRLAIVVFRY